MPLFTVAGALVDVPNIGFSPFAGTGVPMLLFVLGLPILAVLSSHQSRQPMFNILLGRVVEIVAPGIQMSVAIFCGSRVLDSCFVFSSPVLG